MHFTCIYLCKMLVMVPCWFVCITLLFIGSQHLTRRSIMTGGPCNSLYVLESVIIWLPHRFAFWVIHAFHLKQKCIPVVFGCPGNQVRGHLVLRRIQLPQHFPVCSVKNNCLQYNSFRRRHLKGRYSAPFRMNTVEHRFTVNLLIQLSPK